MLQQDSSKKPVSRSGLSLAAIPTTAATLEVMTSLFTPYAEQALRTASVPSTAGLITSSGLAGKKKGEAV